jgi:hypothetical protein
MFDAEGQRALVRQLWRVVYDERDYEKVGTWDYSNMATALDDAPKWWLEHIATANPQDIIS